MSLLDENTAFLKEFADDGLNMTEVRAVEFAQTFPTSEDAEAFAEAVDHEDVTIDLLEPEEDGEPWIIAVTYEMALDAATITATEEKLDALARKFNGESDGWGVYDDE